MCRTLAIYPPLFRHSLCLNMEAVTLPLFICVVSAHGWTHQLLVFMLMECRYWIRVLLTSTLMILTVSTYCMVLKERFTEWIQKADSFVCIVVTHSSIRAQMLSSRLVQGYCARWNWAIIKSSMTSVPSLYQLSMVDKMASSETNLTEVVPTLSMSSEARDALCGKRQTDGCLIG